MPECKGAGVGFDDSCWMAAAQGDGIVELCNTQSIDRKVAQDCCMTGELYNTTFNWQPCCLPLGKPVTEPPHIEPSLAKLLHGLE